MLARVVLLGLLSSFAATAAPPKQATRSEIVVRNYERRAAPLMARSSPAVCPSGVQDSQGSCCAATTQSTTNGQCCTENVYQLQTCGSDACCAGGQTQVLSVPGMENGNSGFRRTCCPSGTVVTDNFMSTGTCAPGMRKRDLRALDLSKRDIQDPLRQMHFREGTWRTQLTPHLVADLLVDDWQMSYNGHTFIDWPARQATGSSSFKKLAKFLPDAIKWRGTTDYLARAHAQGEEFIPIPYSDDYEIALEDVPKIYRAILEHPNFNGRSIEVNGIEYSPTLMKEIFSHAYNWNATVHDIP